jgi:hypothetical protein
MRVCEGEGGRQVSVQPTMADTGLKWCTAHSRQAQGPRSSCRTLRRSRGMVAVLSMPPPSANATCTRGGRGGGAVLSVPAVQAGPCRCTGGTLGSQRHVLACGGQRTGSQAGCQARPPPGCRCSPAGSSSTSSRCRSAAGRSPSRRLHPGCWEGREAGRGERRGGCSGGPTSGARPVGAW